MVSQWLAAEPTIWKHCCACGCVCVCVWVCVCVCVRADSDATRTTGRARRETFRLEQIDNGRCAILPDCCV